MSPRRARYDAVWANLKLPYEGWVSRCRSESIWNDTDPISIWDAPSRQGGMSLIGRVLVNKADTVLYFKWTRSSPVSSLSGVSCLCRLDQEIPLDYIRWDTNLEMWSLRTEEFQHLGQTWSVETMEVVLLEDCLRLRTTASPSMDVHPMYGIMGCIVAYIRWERQN